MNDRCADVQFKNTIMLKIVYGALAAQFKGDAWTSVQIGKSSQARLATYDYPICLKFTTLP